MKIGAHPLAHRGQLELYFNDAVGTGSASLEPKIFEAPADAHPVLEPTLGVGTNTPLHVSVLNSLSVHIRSTVP